MVQLLANVSGDLISRSGGFYKIAFGAKGEDFSFILLLGKVRKDHNRRLVLFFSHLIKHVKTVFIRHDKIQNHIAETPFAELIKGFLAITRGRNKKTLFRQGMA